MIDDIFAALMLAHPSDLGTIKHYIRWVKFRRVIHNRFYFNAYWVRSGRKYHWVR